MTRVELNAAEMHRIEHSLEVRADLLHRAELVTAEASRRARDVSPSWAKTFDHEAGSDERGAYEDVSWRLTAGRGTGGGWRGEFYLFGTSEPNHPAHMDVLLGALDEA